MENDLFVTQTSDVYRLIKLNYAALYLSNFEKQEISLTISVVDKGIVVVLELNDKKRHYSTCQCVNTTMELFKYQNKRWCGFTK